MKLLKQLYSFFASVQLAIFVLSILAVSSIIGTVIPQGETASFYIKNFGPKSAAFIHVLDLSEMYSSWWFLGFIGLLALNLVVCSIKRFPLAWKMIYRDNLTASNTHLKKMPVTFQWQSTVPCSMEELRGNLQQTEWKQWEQKSDDGNTVFFTQKGRWSRLGVYLVHLSILVIFLGSLVGYFTGFRAGVMISEGQGTDTVYSLKDQKPISLGFTVHCNAFSIDFYDTGMPKEYRSDLSILGKDNHLIKREDIMVNTPLTYKGITFYQSSYEGYRDFLVTLIDKTSGERKIFQLPFQKSTVWQEKSAQIGVLNVQSQGMRVLREKIWVKIGDAPAVKWWLADNTAKTFISEGKEYEIKVKQLYATGLQVSKDPGIWLVYIGCLMMLIGLYMSFFMCHRRAWLFWKSAENSFFLAADSNKNRPAMQKKMAQLHAQLQALYPPLQK